MKDIEGYEELMAKLLDTLPVEQRLAGLDPDQRLAVTCELLLAGIPLEPRVAGIPLEQLLAGIPPERRLAGIPPERRLVGLDRDHQALALPLEVLRLLPESYLRSLSPEVEAKIRLRLGQNGR